MDTKRETRTHFGGCHCGAVRYAVDAAPERGISRCNCSMCMKLGRSGVIVKPEAFRLLAGDEMLGEYAFGPVARYLFCKRCGVHSFGRGSLDVLGGDYVSINTQCLDDFDPETVPVVYWDGRHDNWHAGPSDTPWPVRPMMPRAAPDEAA